MNFKLPIYLLFITDTVVINAYTTTISTDEGVRESVKDYMDYNPSMNVEEDSGSTSNLRQRFLADAPETNGTAAPSLIPTIAPSLAPSVLPSDFPSSVPTISGKPTTSALPSDAPSTVPSDMPTWGTNYSDYPIFQEDQGDPFNISFYENATIKIEQWELDVLKGFYMVRLEDGVTHPLCFNDKLMTMARNHMADVDGKGGLLGHIGSDGSTTSDRLYRDGYDYQKFAANLMQSKCHDWECAIENRHMYFSKIGKYTQLGIAKEKHNPKNDPRWYFVFGQNEDENCTLMDTHKIDWPYYTPTVPDADDMDRPKSRPGDGTELVEDWMVAFITLINAERQHEGAPLVSLNKKLILAANQHLTDLSVNCFAKAEAVTQSAAVLHENNKFDEGDLTKKDLKAIVKSAKEGGVKLSDKNDDARQAVADEAHAWLMDNLPDINDIDDTGIRTLANFTETEVPEVPVNTTNSTAGEAIDNSSLPLPLPDDLKQQVMDGIVTVLRDKKELKEKKIDGKTLKALTLITHTAMPSSQLALEEALEYFRVTEISEGDLKKNELKKLAGIAGITYNGNNTAETYNLTFTVLQAVPIQLKAVRGNVGGEFIYYDELEFLCDFAGVTFPTTQKSLDDALFWLASEMPAGMNPDDASEDLVTPLAEALGLQLPPKWDGVPAEFGHTGSDGSSPYKRAYDNGYENYQFLAENIAGPHMPGLQEAIFAWMSSTGNHAQNVIHPDATQMGAGWDPKTGLFTLLLGNYATDEEPSIPSVLCDAKTQPFTIDVLYDTISKASCYLLHDDPQPTFYGMDASTLGIEWYQRSTVEDISNRVTF